jgi:hypothetical protein
MGLIREIRKWFFPRKQFKPALRAIISPYDMQEATEQQRLLMLAHVARSPQDAQALLNRYKAQNAQEVLSQLPPRKRRSLKRRFILLMRRIEGHDPTDPYYRDDNEITVRYRYK